VEFRSQRFLDQYRDCRTLASLEGRAISDRKDGGSSGLVIAGCDASLLTGNDAVSARNAVPQKW
jgi:hypothetical protein